MASPASIGEIELTEEVTQGKVPASVQTDVPDFFYCVELPEVMWVFMCLCWISGC